MGRGCAGGGAGLVRRGAPRPGDDVAGRCCGGGRGCGGAGSRGEEIRPGDFSGSHDSETGGRADARGVKTNGTVMAAPRILMRRVIQWADFGGTRAAQDSKRILNLIETLVLIPSCIFL